MKRKSHPKPALQPESKTKARVVFTQGGKGGVGKTEVALALASWYAEQSISPVLIDFDAENLNNSALKNFYPGAMKLDVHSEGALDELFEVCDQGAPVVLADLGSGAGIPTYQWFDKAFDLAAEMDIRFTAVGVTTNDPGSVQSILRWADRLQDQVSYLIVFNEMRTAGCSFGYWHDDPRVASFSEIFKPVGMTMDARVDEFQTSLRNHMVTLQQIIEGKTGVPFFGKMKNIMRAKRYQRDLFAGFDRARHILLP